MKLKVCTAERYWHSGRSRNAKRMETGASKLSKWRQGAYREWLDCRSCVEDVRDLSEQAARATLTDISGEHLNLDLPECKTRQRALNRRGALTAWRPEPQSPWIGQFFHLPFSIFHLPSSIASPGFAWISPDRANHPSQKSAFIVF